MIGFADISLQKTAKTARGGRGRPDWERAVRHAAGLTRRFQCRPVPLPDSILLGDFVVAPLPDALPLLIVRRGDATRASLRRPLRVTVIVQGDS
jgi:hypothetical protein